MGSCWVPRRSGLRLVTRRLCCRPFLSGLYNTFDVFPSVLSWCLCFVLLLSVASVLFLGALVFGCGSLPGILRCLLILQGGLPPCGACVWCSKVMDSVGGACLLIFCCSSGLWGVIVRGGCSCGLWSSFCGFLCSFPSVFVFSLDPVMFDKLVLRLF